jgi:hypothetical protein
VVNPGAEKWQWGTVGMANRRWPRSEVVGAVRAPSGL